jgi:hypothetical protein
VQTLRIHAPVSALAAAPFNLLPVLVGARTVPIVAIQVSISFGNKGDRFVAVPLEDRVQYRPAEHFGKLIPMVMTKDVGRFNELSASVSQALSACIPLSDHRSLCEEREIAGRPKFPWRLRRRPQALRLQRGAGAVRSRRRCLPRSQSFPAILRKCAQRLLKADRRRECH